MRNLSQDELRDTLRARQLASQATTTRIAGDTNSHVGGSDTSHYLADSKSTRSDPHDLSASFDTDTSIDDKGDDGEREALNHPDTPDDQGVEQRTDSEQEQSCRKYPIVYKTSDRASHDSGSTGDGTAAFKAFGHVLCFHPGLGNMALIVEKCVEFTRSRIFYHIG